MFNGSEKSLTWDVIKRLLNIQSKQKTAELECGKKEVLRRLSKSDSHELESSTNDQRQCEAIRAAKTSYKANPFLVKRVVINKFSVKLRRQNLLPRSAETRNLTHFRNKKRSNPGCANRISLWFPSEKSSEDRTWRETRIAHKIRERNILKVLKQRRSHKYSQIIPDNGYLKFKNGASPSLDHTVPHFVSSFVSPRYQPSAAFYLHWFFAGEEVVWLFYRRVNPAFGVSSATDVMSRLWLWNLIENSNCECDSEGIAVKLSHCAVNYRDLQSLTGLRKHV